MKRLFERFCKEELEFEAGDYFKSAASSVSVDFNAWIAAKGLHKDSRVRKFEVRKWLEKKVGYVRRIV